MAVLARTNAQLVPLQEALQAAGIPCWAPSRRALLDEPVVRRVLAGLRQRPASPIQMVAADLEAEADAGDEDEVAVLGALAEMARGYCREEPDSVAGQWLAWLPTVLADDRSGEDGDAVTLCSFHRAKGLEWDCVWITGLEQGLVPIGRATTDAAVAEERRLLYVAVTRAGMELRCSWARQRTFGSRPVPRQASPWLEALRSATDGESPAPDVAHWRERLREQRRQLARPGGPRRAGKARVPGGWPEPDPELIVALRSWRSETARAAGLPANSVLHDATLAAVAALRPQTSAALLDVPGLGPVKAGRYGPTLLSLVADQAAAG
jgi:DNA helicase-2/ATP-dependent DNA helicase PcrA